MTAPQNWPELLRIVIPAALEAGAAIMEVYARDFAVEYKDDHSPLTDADRASHECIVQHLQGTGIPVVSEESEDAPYEVRRHWPMQWLVDPLDGTKEFVKRNGDFTVNIALLDKTHPVLGAVYAPVANELYFGVRGVGSYRVAGADSFAKIPDALKRLPRFEAPFQRLPLHRPASAGADTVRVVMSRSHMNEETRAFVEALEKKGKRVEAISRGSSIKLCLVASGEADVYPRLGPTMEWDTAAAHAIIEAAGGQVMSGVPAVPGKSLSYNKSSRLNGNFLASIEPF